MFAWAIVCGLAFEDRGLRLAAVATGCIVMAIAFLIVDEIGVKHE